MIATAFNQCGIFAAALFLIYWNYWKCPMGLGNGALSLFSFFCMVINTQRSAHCKFVALCILPKDVHPAQLALHPYLSQPGEASWPQHGKGSEKLLFVQVGQPDACLLAHHSDALESYRRAKCTTALRMKLD